MNNTCAILHRKFHAEDLMPLSAIRPRIAAMVREKYPGLTEDSLISAEALAPVRSEYVRNRLEEDIGQLSNLENDVVESLREHETVAANVEAQFQTKISRGDRWADRLADFGGSWAFLIWFGSLMFVWIALNIILHASAPDPYPFILLNLLLSCLAAIQAPVIMMSQNRQEAKDRLRGEHDYKVNLKAELEVRHLHEKVDFLLKQQAQRMFALQELQIELMSEIAQRHKKPPV
jgi:uncharacterized membrane protein